MASLKGGPFISFPMLTTWGVAHEHRWPCVAKYGWTWVETHPADCSLTQAETRSYESHGSKNPGLTWLSHPLKRVLDDWLVTSLQIVLSSQRWHDDPQWHSDTFQLEAPTSSIHGMVSYQILGLFLPDSKDNARQFFVHVNQHMETIPESNMAGTSSSTWMIFP